MFVVEATGPDLLAGPGPLRQAVEEVPLGWPLLLDLTLVDGPQGPDPVALGVLAATAHRRLRAGTALAVVGRPRLLASLRAAGLSRLAELHEDVGPAAHALRSRSRADPHRPIAYWRPAAEGG